MPTAGTPREETTPEERGKQPVLRGGHGHLAHQQRPAVQGAERRDHHGDSDRAGRPGAPHDLRRVGERRHRFHELLARHDAQDDSRAEYVQEGGDGHAEDGRTGNRPRGIDHISCRHGSRLETKEGEHRQRRERRVDVSSDWPLGLNSDRFSGRMKSSPMTEMARKAQASSRW